MTTPPLRQESLPRFLEIRPERIKPLMSELITRSKQNLNNIIGQPGPYTWDNLMQPIEEMCDELNQTWSSISHMHAVLDTDELRKAYNETQPLMTEFFTDLSQNEPLFHAMSAIAKSADENNLNPAQKKILENEIRDFKLAGIHLPPEKKAKMAALQKQLTQLSTTFSENLLDATQGWFLHVTDANQLEGLPLQAFQLAVDSAKERGLEGYVITLDYPFYSVAIRFLKDRELRKKLYFANVTRASDQGPNAGKWNNTKTMEDILKTRQEIATLVGYPNFAEYSLATKMAKKPEDVLSFIQDLVQRSKPFASNEYQEVVAYAKKIDGIDPLEVWDLAFYSERLKENKFNFSPEHLRPFFPVQKVLQGMFLIVNKLYGITIREQLDIEVWHPHVQFFAIYDDRNELRGGFYIDLYARAHKREGAWMDDCRIRRRLPNNDIQHPVAYLTCNFMPPVDSQPTLLTHEDVLTLFHEFGHCLHHMLTKVDYPSVAGINGVPWDAVEFPSQFMENFCWEKESLALIAEHYQTGEPLPDALYNNMIAAKNFQTGLQMLRQLEYSLFDFRLHLEYDPNQTGQIQAILDDVRKQVAIVHLPAFNRFQHGFAHIFGGGYAAGYYSYKWAEVLSADAYEKFLENGIFDRATGRSFMQNILEVGGVRDPLVSFSAFRGREPRIDALLKQSGIK